MRTIEANKLYEAFRDAKGCYTSCDKCKATNCTIGDVLRTLPTIEAEPAGWISVKDRLPENDGEYMVWYKSKCEICEFDTDSQTFGYTYEDFDEMYSCLLCWDDGLNQVVTHWRPLPEPPKGE